MAVERASPRITPGVDEIPRQHHLETGPGYLARPENRDDDLVDAFLLDVVNLLAALAGAAGADDVDSWMLADLRVRRPGLWFYDRSSQLGGARPEARVLSGILI
jgi:hypothetical protein